MLESCALKSSKIKLLSQSILRVVGAILACSVLSLALSSCASSTASQASQMIGVWYGEAASSTAGIPYTLHILKADGPSFRGTLSTAASIAAVTGSIKGDTVTLNISPQSKFVGVLSGKTWSGSFRKDGRKWNFKFHLSYR